MSIPLGKLVNVNPLTPEFLDDRDAEVSFMPLAAIWPYGRADVSGRAIAARVAGGYTLFRNGDVLVPKITPTFEAARAIVADLQTPLGAGTTELHVLRALPGVDTRFIAYVARSLPFLQEGATTLQGVGNLRRVPTDWLTKFPILITELEEQQAIADYLDRETQRIDELIAEQRGLIEMLRERRQAVVSSELDSAGGDYLRLGRLFTFHNGDRGANYPDRDEFTTDGVPFINAGDIGAGRIDYSTTNYITPEKFASMGGAKLMDGDVLFCLRGSLGKLGMFIGEGTAALASSLVALRAIGHHIDSRFFVYVLSSLEVTEWIATSQTGSAQPNLSVEQLRGLHVRVPDHPNQLIVRERLDAQTSHIDALIAESEDLIALSQERRAALITAAVTGQIDVRTAA